MLTLAILFISNTNNPKRGKWVARGSDKARDHIIKARDDTMNYQWRKIQHAIRSAMG